MITHLWARQRDVRLRESDRGEEVALGGSVCAKTSWVRMIAITAPSKVRARSILHRPSSWRSLGTTARWGQRKPPARKEKVGEGKERGREPLSTPIPREVKTRMA